MPDDFDDIIDKIKKYFKLNSDIFDIDFLFIPESKKDFKLDPEDKNIKGLKVSYHFESGMDKPEIKIEGNIDKKRIHDYLKNVDLSKYPTLERLFDTKFMEEIDASELSLEYTRDSKDLSVLEPITEINDCKDFTEIILEIPGMRKEDVQINYSEEGTKLIFKAENQFRKFMKHIYLPFKSSFKDSQLEVNNGLAIIKVKNSNK
ncbi:MAG: Hsp20/alpha crystallin family protein [Promethearchaeota archaeon]